MRNTTNSSPSKIFLPNLKKTNFNNDPMQRSEQKIPKYVSSSGLEKKFNSTFHLKLDKLEDVPSEQHTPSNIKKALKTFGNVIKNMKYPVQINREIKYYSHHKTNDETDKKIFKTDGILNSNLLSDPSSSSLDLDIKSNLFQRLDQDNRDKIQRICTLFSRLLEFLNSQNLKITLSSRNELKEQVMAIEGLFNNSIKSIMENYNSLFFSKEKDLIINQLNLKVMKLTKELEMFQKTSEISKKNTPEQEITMNTSENDITQKYLQYFEKSQNIIKNQEKKLEVLFAKMAAYKHNRDDLELRVKLLQEENSQAIIHERLHTELTDKIRALQETCMMQFEEIQTIKQEKQQIIANFSKTLSQMSSMSKKITRNMSFLIPEEKEFFANDVLNEVRTVISTEFSKMMDFSTPEENMNLDEINLERFQFFKPTFFHCFLKDPKIFLETGPKFEPTAKDNIMVVMTIRGIFDSKHNEYMFSENYRNYSRFGDFVFSWLCNFYVDDEKRCVFDRAFPAGPEIATKFLDTMLKFNKTWELFTFKDFLEEKSSPDEVFFYLHCRFLIFNGPQLKRFRGGFDYVDYVKLEHVLNVVDLVFKNFDPQTRVFIVNKLQAKSKINGGIILIDSAFALRIFLEYYKLERVLIYKLLVKNFRSITKAANIKDFMPFVKVLHKMLPASGDLDKMELFRQCYEVSRGGINPDTMFTVFSESGFLIKVIKSQYFVNEKYNDDYTGAINFINNHFKKMNDEMIFIRSKVQSLGIEDLKEEYGKYHTIFMERNFNFYKKNSFQGKNLFLVYSRLIEIFLKVRNIEVFNSYNSPDTELFFIKNDFLAYDTILVLIKTLLNKDKVKEFEYSRNAKKIQSSVKRKINKWYTLISSIIPSRNKGN